MDSKVKDALELVGNLIHHQYTGSREAMTALQVAGDACAEALASLLPAQEPIAWFCVNRVTGKMLYTDSESEATNMRESKDKHWQVTPLYASPLPQSASTEAQKAREQAREEAAKWVDQRRFDFEAEHGSVDPSTGALEFGRGQRAQLQEEYVAELAEIAEGIRALQSQSLPSAEGDAERLREAIRQAVAILQPTKRSPDQQEAFDVLSAAISQKESNHG